jgi:hypothetical protein
MIVFDLACPGGHRFEGWFASSAAFADQQAQGLVSCPQCGACEVNKAPMAPAVPRKGSQLPAAKPAQPVLGGAMPDEARRMLAKLAEFQAKALRQSRWVGAEFAEQSLEMYYGERAVETIHGQATAKQAHELIDEGIAVMPLPFPVAPPEDLN